MNNQGYEIKSDEELSVEEALETTRKTKGRKLFWLLAVIVLGLAALGFYVFMPKGGPGEGGLLFQTQEVKQGDLVVTVTATGNLEATNEVEVGSELSGRIIKMTADYNDKVTSGQPLAYLDDTSYLANVAKSKSQVASAKANYAQTLATKNAAEKKLRRYQKTRELTNNKLPSMEDLEEAEADLERAVADVDAAQAAIDTAYASLKSDEVDLKKTVIYSPIHGLVLSKDVEVGQTVAASLEAPTIYTLAEDLRQMKLVVDVDEADVGVVKEGQAASFTVDAYPERSFQAEIVQVRYGADENDGVVTYSTVLKVDNPDMSLRPGMTATADITVQKLENVLLIPNTALRFSPPQPEGGPPAAGQPAAEKRGFLSSLMPGPPRHDRATKKVEVRPESEKGESVIWVLQNNHPEPVRVVRMATDGVMTAVESPELTTASKVITSTMTTGK